MTPQTPPTPWPQPARRWQARTTAWLARDAWPFLLFLAVALLAIYPLLANPRSTVLGGIGDNLQYVYMAGWMGQAPLLGRSPFVDPRANFPDGLLLTATDAPYLHMLAVAPVSLLAGPVLSYNLIIFLSHLLSGYVVYLWLLRLTGSRVGAAVAGLSFMLAPHRIIHSYGNLPVVLTQASVLFFWALDAALSPERPGRRGLLLLFGATLFLGGTSQYLLVMGLLCGVAYALLTLLPRPAYLLRHGWAVALAVVLGAGLGALPYLLSAQRDSYSAYTLDAMRHWSSDPINFIKPPLLHPLWGAWFHALRPEPLFGEKSLYLGVICMALAAVALLWPDNPHRRRCRVWLGVALLAAVLCLGTDLHLGDRPLNPDDPLFLPAYYLGQLPFLSFMRVWPRFGVVVSLFFSMLAGVGAALLVARAARWRTQAGPLLAGLLVALTLLDLLPGANHGSAVAPRPVDRWLAAQPGDFAVGFITSDAPDNDIFNYRVLFGSLTHGKHVTGFYHPYHRTEAFLEFRHLAAGFPAPESVAALREFGLRYLVLEHSRFDDVYLQRWEDVRAALPQRPDLEVVAELEGVTVVAFREDE